MKVLVNGVHLYFDVEGAELVPDGVEMRRRPVVVALHGGPGVDHSTLKPALSRLADVAQVVYVDQRGHGRSDHGESALWTIEQLADDVVAFCIALGIERPIVYGQSFGAMVAMTYATRHPDHPQALVLVAAPAVGHGATIERTVAAFRRVGGDAVADVYRRDAEQPSQETQEEWLRVCLPYLSRLPDAAGAMKEMRSRAVEHPEINLHLNAATRDFDIRGSLARITCPTLVIVGEDDPLTPVEDADEIASYIGDDHARVVRIRGAAHTVFRDRPDEAHHEVRAFVSEVGVVHPQRSPSVTTDT